MKQRKNENVDDKNNNMFKLSNEQQLLNFEQQEEAMDST